MQAVRTHVQANHAPQRSPDHSHNALSDTNEDVSRGDNATARPLQSASAQVLTALDEIELIRSNSSSEPPRLGSSIYQDEIDTENSVSSRLLSTSPTNGDTQHSAGTPKVSAYNIAELDNITSDWRDLKYGQVEFFRTWFPEVDPAHKTFRSRRSRRKAMLLTALATSTAVLLANVVALIVLEVKYKADRGVVPMYEGGCSLVKRLDIVAHIFINILSTLLLGASNLCMQLMVAPTRKEVDKAHSSQKWLDIGVPSFRNLFRIRRSRVVMWVFLVVSSLPLHFIYNSVMSTSLPIYEIAIAAVSENFLRGAPFGNGFVNNQNISLTITPGPWIPQGESFVGWPPLEIWNGTSALISWPTAALDPNKFSNMSNLDCLDHYTNTLSRRTNLIFVLEELPEDANASVHQYWYDEGGFQDSGIWPCDNMNTSLSSVSCIPPEWREDVASEWDKFNRRVLYCLSEIPPPGDHCRFNYSPDILIAICVLSAIKCICIGILATRYRDHTLATIGDAICSFLSEPDKTTAHMGFATKDVVSRASSHAWKPGSTCTAPRRRVRMYSAASRRRWVLTVSLGAIAVVIAAISLGTGAQGTTRRSSESFSWQLRQPLGAPSFMMITGYSLPHYGLWAFISVVLYANVWQVVVSCLYFAFNALLTSMVVAEEWNGYAKDRKTLRVSHPKGIQRGSYFVSMPFRYGVPLMALITTLHWLISQSMFLISTTTLYPSLVENESSSWSAVGYSTSASLTATLFGTCAIIIVVLFSLRRLPLSNMPMAATCSAAISAACHRPEQDVYAHLFPLKWGIITTQETPALTAFTTWRDVRPPREDEKIVGFEEPPKHTVRASKLIACVFPDLKKMFKRGKRED